MSERTKIRGVNDAQRITDIAVTDEGKLRVRPEGPQATNEDGDLVDVAATASGLLRVRPEEMRATDQEGDPVAVVATSGGAVHMAEQYPAYEQYQLADLGSEEVAAGATEYLPAYASIPGLSERVLLLTITGDGTATIGVDIAVELSAGVPVWHRYATALATGLTKTSGNGGAVVLALPAGLWARYLRIWVTETGTSDTVTVAAKVGGRP